ncbi:MAG TPA: GTP cyclohydrolase I FolE [Acidimicrobiales bacterium]|nr:GTP cyclohydrolase I FolE [Acidimicrobiales bacterium]
MTTDTPSTPFRDGASDDDWPAPAREFPALDTPMDLDRIGKAVREILEAIGEDPDRDGLRDTPQRVARMYAEVCSGLHEDADTHLAVTFEAGHDEMVMVRDIELHSLCEHHLVPFIGKAHIAYIPGPDGRITGLSKLARLVDAYARRPQVQEKLTRQIADQVETTLAPQGVMVVIVAEHLCMTMRGIRKAGSTTVTSAVRGLFRHSVATREEAMRFINGQR